MTNTLHIDTPLSLAIFRFFDYLREDILKNTSKPGSVKAYIFGGCALHIHTNARGSNDIDVEFNSAKWLRGKDIVINNSRITYKSGDKRFTLVLDGNFTPTLGPIHEDYQDDAIQLQKHLPNSPLWIYVVTPEDLAVSKLGRFGEQDRNDILTLLKMKKMTLDSFTKRANEALKYYVGSVDTAKGSLDYIIRQYQQMAKQ